LIVNILLFFLVEKKWKKWKINIFLTFWGQFFASWVKVFPNPSQDKINVAFIGSSEDVSVLITDILGKQLFNQKYSNPSGHFNEQINIQNFNLDNAILTIMQGGKVYSQKITLTK